MRHHLGIAAALLTVVAGGSDAAHAPKLVLPLVRAHCEGTPPQPCQPAFTFRSGVAVLTSAKQPAPTCPKTGKPSETRAGSVQLTEVTRDGSAYTGSLAVEVTNLTTFGSDGGDCELNGLQIETLTILGTLICRNGRCKGMLLPFACLPRNCADAPITTELRLLEVLDLPTLEGGKAVARPGLFVTPGK